MGYMIELKSEFTTTTLWAISADDKWMIFLAHLSRTDKVSFCDRILSVVRRACVRASMRPSVRKQFIQTTSPLNHSLDFDQTSKE